MSRSLGGLETMLETHAEQLQWLQGDVTSADDRRGWPAVLRSWERCITGTQRRHRRTRRRAGHGCLRPAVGGQRRRRAEHLRRVAQRAGQARLGGIHRHLPDPLGIPGLGAYIASKAALAARRPLAAEFAPLDVRLNMVSPGPTATAIWGTLGLSDDQLEAVADGVTKRLLPGHFLESAAVANVILFQLSWCARCVRRDWVVDNGYTIS